MGRFGNDPNAVAGQGAVRIIWGQGRSFPSTNTSQASSLGYVSTY
jgi:hypothetical protein